MDTYFSDSEYRLLFSALARERKVCEMVDKDCVEEHKQIRIMNNLEKKIRHIQHDLRYVQGHLN